MKRFPQVLIFGLLLLTACVKSPDLIPQNQALPSTATTPTSGTSAMPGSSTAVVASSLKLIAQGTFVNEVHPASGTVRIYRDTLTSKQILSFENFSTDAGPDLRVYLSQDRTTGNFTEVARLINSGSFYYEIPVTTTPAQQMTVLIWCKRFSVLFGSAKLIQR